MKHSIRLVGTMLFGVPIGRLLAYDSANWPFAVIGFTGLGIVLAANLLPSTKWPIKY